MTSFIEFFTVFAGILGQETKKFFTHTDATTMTLDPIKDNVAFYQTNKLLERFAEFKSSLSQILDEAEMQSLLPFLRAELFEPHRDCEDMHDEVGYLDESWRMFTGISDSHVPIIRLPMNVIHYLAHRWPTELLYEQIVRVIRARNDRRFRKIAL